MFFLCFIILAIFQLFLAHKDAMSYLLKDKSLSGEATKKIIRRWHADGVGIVAIFTIVLYWATKTWEVVPSVLLARLTVYDLAFNKWSKLNIHFLGSTAYWDKIFIKMFGINGAVKKSLFFGAVTVIWGLLKLIL